jgi:4-hydroxy-tetrahydrodipicolinate synthase
VISVAGNWAAGEIAGSIRSFLSGDIDRARQLNAAMLGSYTFETSEDAPNPLPAKAMLRVMGRPGGGCRLPLGEFPPGLEDRAKRVLADLEAWRKADAMAAAAR